ncbi:MAG TPA: hypothetical protein VM029_21185 [Opitutaceae bacterium]|nr:hypothetical protein [Opitutaceae bacterium]
MKYRTLTLLVLLTAAAVAGTVAYQLGSERELRVAARAGDPMLWLRSEFRLSEAQHARIAQLHQDYAKICGDHCYAIQQAMEAAAAARAAKVGDAKIAENDRRVRELEKVCEQAIEKHLRAVAACMPPPEGERYLGLVLPRIAGFDHAGPPDLGLRR